MFKMFIAKIFKKPEPIREWALERYGVLGLMIKLDEALEQLKDALTMENNQAREVVIDVLSRVRRISEAGLAMLEAGQLTRTGERLEDYKVLSREQVEALIERLRKLRRAQ